MCSLMKMPDENVFSRGMKTKREHVHEGANLKSPCRQRESASTFVYRRGLFASRHGANFNRVSSEMFLVLHPTVIPSRVFFVPCKPR